MLKSVPEERNTKSQAITKKSMNPKYEETLEASALVNL
jgi:hypothetical protein